MKERKKPGPKARDTRLYKGAAVEALADTGMPPGQIAEAVGVSLSVVDDILHGRGRWASLHTDQALQQYRQQQTRQHELMARELSTKLLERIEKTINTGGLSQAVIAFGILQDKARLLAGESTQNIAFGGTVRIESEKLTDMLARLVSSLTDELPKSAVEETEAQIVETKEEPPCTTPASNPATGLGLSGATG